MCAFINELREKTFEKYLQNIDDIAEGIIEIISREF